MQQNDTKTDFSQNPIFSSTEASNVKEEEPTKIEPKEDEEQDYIEYDHDLFFPQSHTLKNKIKKYRGDPSKLFKKIRKIRRKAVVKLSKENPMIIDKISRLKLKYFIDLNGEYSRKKIEFHVSCKKIAHKFAMGLPILPDRYELKNRYFSQKISQPTSKMVLNQNPSKTLPDFVKIPEYETPNFEEETNRDVLTKLTELNKKVNDDPKDIQSWLLLVDIQREKLGKNVSEKAVIDSQLAVLNKAINSNPKSEELLLRQLYITYNVSDSKSLRLALDHIVFTFPNKISFWTIYFQYNQADFSTLSLKSVIELYSKALAKIQSLKSPNVQPSQRLIEPLGSVFQLRLYVQLGLFLMGANQSEKLISLFQLLLECNFSMNAASKLSATRHDRILLHLESFWDSPSSKIGEKQASGLVSHVFQHKNTQDVLYAHDRQESFYSLFENPAISQVIYDSIEKNLTTISDDNNKTWAAIEYFRSTHDVLPVKSNVEIDDDERIVLFDDVKTVIFKFDDALTLELSLLFLIFLNVPVPRSFCPNVCAQLHDCLTLSDITLQHPDSITQFGVLVGGDNIYFYNSLSPIWVHFGCDPPSCHLPPDPGVLYFIRMLFTALISMKYFDENDINRLSYVWLQYELFISTLFPSNENNFHKTAIFAKKLLQLPENRSYEPLWVLYSFSLVYSCQTKLYVKTMSKLVNSLKMAGSSSTYGVFLIFFIQNVILHDLEILAGKEFLIRLMHEFVESMYEISYNSPVDLNTLILAKVTKLGNELNCLNLIYCQFFESILILGHSSAISNLIQWIELCAKNCEITETANIINLYDFKIAKYNENSPVYSLCKSISQRFCSIIWHPAMYPHVNHHALVNVMYLCVPMFPNNVTILQWFYRHIQSAPFLYSVRSCFNYMISNCLQSTSTELSCFIFNVYSEILMSKRFGNGQDTKDVFLKNSDVGYRLKALFEKVCSNSNFMFRPLGIMDDQEMLRSVFYRSLQHTPWYAVNFGILDCQSISDMMLEKGIRLRFPVEELELLKI